MRLLCFSSRCSGRPKACRGRCSTPRSEQSRCWPDGGLSRLLTVASLPPSSCAIVLGPASLPVRSRTCPAARSLNSSGERPRCTGCRYRDNSTCSSSAFESGYPLLLARIPGHADARVDGPLDVKNALGGAVTRRRWFRGPSQPAGAAAGVGWDGRCGVRGLACVPATGGPLAGPHRIEDQVHGGVVSRPCSMVH